MIKLWFTILHLLNDWVVYFHDAKMVNESFIMCNSQWVVLYQSISKKLRQQMFSQPCLKNGFGRSSTDIRHYINTHLWRNKRLLSIYLLLLIESFTKSICILDKTNTVNIYIWPTIYLAAHSFLHLWVPRSPFLYLKAG